MDNTKQPLPDSFATLDADVIACERCPRLRDWCIRIAEQRRASFADWEYWARPVPGFGDPEADCLIVGLAPAAHGANRTGRIFTGDRSGDWLFRALAKAGAANQPTSSHRDDGLRLSGVYITAVVHCAPPDNKPNPAEMLACSEYLRRTLDMRRWRAILCLGAIAWRSICREYAVRPMPGFGHLALFELEQGPRIIGSYHPSQQNTFTGKLTEHMLDQAIALLLAAGC